MTENSDNNGEGRVEYDSDPEDSKLCLKARRREASDDEEEEGRQQRVDREGSNQRPPRRVDVSDDESQGAVAEYEDALGEGEDYAEEGLEEEDEYCEDEYDDVYSEEDGVGRDGGMLVEGRNKLVAESKDGNLRDGAGGEERKDAAVEPFSVPKAGAFYMHDDRFVDDARGGRHRRTIRGRRLWQSKDNSKWGHDKFEELTTRERHGEEHRRGSRGRSLGRGRAGGAERRFAQVLRSLPKNITHEIPNDASKSVRGRGPRRYQSSFKNKYEQPTTQNKRSGESFDEASRVSPVNSNKPLYAAPSTGPQRKQVASNLNIASPPFYPTGSSTDSSAKGNNIGLQQKDVQVSAANQNGQSTSRLRGKNVADSAGMEKLSINDSNPSMTGRASNMHMPLSNSSFHNSGRPQLRGQGRGMTSASHMVYQPVASVNQVNRVPPAGQIQNFPMNSGQNHGQTSVRGSGQPFVQRMAGQSPSPSKSAGAVKEFESEVEPSSESGDYKTSLAIEGRGTGQQSGKSSFVYGGSQVMGGPGNINSAHGDQNFPTFLPIMQLGAQHPGGIGVPAVGMAFPGYVGGPQQGRGNSEMTWLPLLASAAGALGSPYCPPYITVDGSYNARPLGQTPTTMSNSISSNDNNAAKVSGDMGQAQIPDLGTEDLGQRQKNTRRYTEMKFNQ